MKQYGVLVPGSLVTAKTAPGYLKRTILYALQHEHGLTMEASVFMTDIEQRIINAGLMTCEAVEAIECEAFAEYEEV